MKFIRPKKGTPEHEEVCAIMRGGGMRGGDYKGEPSDYQAALKKWNISKGWKETHIWQAPHKGHRGLKASSEYEEVIQSMKGNRESLRKQFETLYDKLRAKTKFGKQNLDGQYRVYLNKVEAKVRDERKVAERMFKWIENVRQQNIAKFGEDPLTDVEEPAEAPVPKPKEKPIVEEAPPAPKTFTGAINVDQSFAPNKEKKHMGNNIYEPSPHSVYMNLLKLYDYWIKTYRRRGIMKPEKSSDLRKELNDKQRELMEAEENERLRVHKLKEWVNSKVPKAVKNELEQEEKSSSLGHKRYINLRSVDEMRTKDVLIEANVLSGKEDIAERIEAGLSRSTPREMGTSIGDIRAALKELRRRIYGKEDGQVLYKPEYELRAGSIEQL
jgi:hypothetical protein